MNTYFSARKIQQILKCIPFFFAFFLIYSCDSRLENLKTKELKNDISILETSIDELNQKFDSLNFRLQQLEEGTVNEEFVSEMKTEISSISRKITCRKCDGLGREEITCDKCHGSGKDDEWHTGKTRQFQYDCGDCRGKGRIIYECRVCHGNGRINEYE